MAVVAARIGTVQDEGTYNFCKPTLRCQTKWSQFIIVFGIGTCAMRAILRIFVVTPRPKLMESISDVQ